MRKNFRKKKELFSFVRAYPGTIIRNSYYNECYGGVRLARFGVQLVKVLSARSSSLLPHNYILTGDLLITIAKQLPLIQRQRFVICSKQTVLLSKRPELWEFCDFSKLSLRSNSIGTITITTQLIIT